MRLKEKKALVTGGSEGIGLAIAHAFVKEGAQVIIASKSQEKLRKAEKEIGGSVRGIPADVSNVADLNRLYEKIGLLDILVANAGISQATPLASVVEEDFDRIMATNLKGVFFTVQRALSYLRPGGSVILMSSLAGKAGIQDFSVYCASKAGVISLAQSFASEFVQKNIRVNSLSPGVVKTPLLERAAIPKKTLQAWSDAIPMHRFAHVDEIAAAAVFLASDDSAYITASDFPIDGGISGICPF